MRWCVVRHRETGGLGVISETALTIHRELGWQRVSDWTTDQASLHPDLYAEAEPAGDPPLATDPESPADEPAEPQSITETAEEQAQ